MVDDDTPEPDSLVAKKMLANAKNIITTIKAYEYPRSKSLDVRLPFVPGATTSFLAEP